MTCIKTTKMCVSGSGEFQGLVKSNRQAHMCVCKTIGLSASCPRISWRFCTRSRMQQGRSHAKHGNGPLQRSTLVEGYSLSGSCISTSRQALIFRRRHTQQRSSDSLLAPASPQTLQSNVFRAEGSKTIFLAESNNLGSTTFGSSGLFLVTFCLSPTTAGTLTIGSVFNEVYRSSVLRPLQRRLLVE